MEEERNGMEEKPFEKQHTGVVVWVKEKEIGGALVGVYGFVRVDNLKMDDIFLHYKELEPWRTSFKTIKQGMRVKFYIKKNEKGFVAKDAEPLPGGDYA